MANIPMRQFSRLEITAGLPPSVQGEIRRRVPRTGPSDDALQRCRSLHSHLCGLESGTFRLVLRLWEGLSSY